ncbi:MAG: YIP1 family protein [Deltaproteobacteria bacterium]|nr:YIP1 family protein [Deltaproteobacteria bacterium]
MDIVSRVKGILLKPKETWLEIKNEPTETKELFTSYAAVLAAIPAVASFIGFSLIGMSILGFHYRMPFISGIGHLIVSYVFSLLGLYVVGLIIDALAPSFGSRKNPVQAMKVAVYSWTPAWLAGILLLIPSLAPLSMLISLYSLYLFYLGLPVLMETPQDKVIGYVMVTILVSIIVSIVIGSLSSALFGFGRGGMMGWRF